MITNIPIVAPIFNFLSFYGFHVATGGGFTILMYFYVLRPWLQKRHRESVASQYCGISFEVARSSKKQ